MNAHVFEVVSTRVELIVEVYFEQHHKAHYHSVS